MLAPNRNMFLGFDVSSLSGDITAEEMSRFGNPKENVFTYIGEIYNGYIFQNKSSFCNAKMCKNLIHQSCLSGD